MPKTYRLLSTVDEASTVLNWFRGLPEPPEEVRREVASLFWFKSAGPLHSVAECSPGVSVFLPVRRRNVLTTIGEVHFLPKRLRDFPSLNRVNKLFQEWLHQYPRVFSRDPDAPHEWDSFLEGSTRNLDSDIYALPGGMTTLAGGAYFVSHGDSAGLINRVCRSLELRGVTGIGPAEPEEPCFR